MIRNIVKKISYHPNLFKAILTYEDIEYRKYLEHQRDNCPHCEKMEKKRREIDKWER